MKHEQRYRTHLLRTAVGLLFVSAFLCRCATIGSPTGGPKDSLPPVIVNLTPDNFSTNRPLTGHERIYIEFDEYVQIKDQQKEFFTSPAMKKKPLITLRGRGIVVQLRDTLAPNTTYSLNFSSAIRDNNEGNPLHSMRYVFSTGPKIDSMVFSGYTADSYKADSVSKSYIWFFPVDSVAEVMQYDSTIFNYKPAQIARAETNGIFIAQNLKPIPYRIYAIQDKNDNQMYEPAVDQVGFLDKTYNPAEMPDFAIWYDSLRRYVTAEPQLYFRMFTDVAFRRQLLQDSKRPLQHKAELYFSAAHPRIEQMRFDSIPLEKVIIEPLTQGKDTLALWFDLPAEQLPDTIKGEVIYYKHDTARQWQLDTAKLKLAWRKIESKEEEKAREKEERERRRAEAAGEEYKEPKKENPFKHNLSLSGGINPEKHLWVEFDYPLSQFDSANVQLLRTITDTETERQPVHFVRDTAHLRRYQICADWKEGAAYTLTIPEGALRNVAGEQNDSIVGKYTVADPTKFASLKIRLEGKDPNASYIVQQLNASGQVQQEKFGVTPASGVVSINYVSPGEIQLRLIEDKNNNGRWDTGNVVERRQPERSELYINEEGESLFVTKANWELEMTLNVDQIFAPVTMESLQRMLDEKEMQRLIREEEKRRKEGKKKDHDHDHSNNAFGNPNMQSTGNMFNTFR